MKLFPRAASAFIFHNPLKSPGRENRQVAGRGFSSPVKISIIPKEAQSKSNSSGFQTPEPTSPKVSCIGQIKHKKKMKEIARNAAAAAAKISQPKKRHPPSVIKRILTGGKILGRAKSNDVAAPSRNHRGGGKPPLPKKAPRLNQMKRFSSGRDTLASFDWTAQIVPADLEGEETEGDWRSPVSEAVWIGEDVGPLQPRKEVNIWKRRTAVPPTPLQLNSS
ncbi:uncharacterized protein At1g76070-like [Cucurbita maxima]|uniref:Uncharacterized protein At1g76070-like n=1 Tax=Cucurbita maxima TaxID=3661 RepID=A0A6J1J4Y0_CUCMA|nr:uncharacterized protein At1g76070-like [Cucurbita maxima]